MQAIVENFITLTDEGTARSFVQIINAITLASDERKLREYIARVNTGEQDRQVGKFFVWGFGAHHFWVHQRLGYDCPEFFPQRIIIARY